MRRALELFLLGCLLLPALTPELEARTRKEDAMAAANAAKESFSTRNSPGDPTTPAAAAGVTTRKLAARVVEPGVEGESVAVAGDRWIDGSDQPWSARVDLTTAEIIAKQRRAFDGRKHLIPDDLIPGHELVLVVEIPSMAIRKVKVVGTGGGR